MFIQYGDAGKFPVGCQHVKKKGKPLFLIKIHVKKKYMLHTL